MEKEQKKTRRGRAGYCNGEKGIRYTFLTCPNVLELLRQYCKKNMVYPSHVIMKALEFYFKNIQE